MHSETCHAHVLPGQLVCLLLECNFCKRHKRPLKSATFSKEDKKPPIVRESWCSLLNQATAQLSPTLMTLIENQGMMF